jgi:hypothetical protein
MYSFLVYASGEKQTDPGVVRRARDIMHELTPSLGCELEVCEREFPQVNGGWFYFYPGGVPGDRLISDFVDDGLAVLAFGRLVRPCSSSMAETVSW